VINISFIQAKIVATLKKSGVEKSGKKTFGLGVLG